MAVDLPYFDSSYLVRLYLDDPGFERVRALAAAAPALASSWHGQAEVIAALHRAYREGRFSVERYLSAVEQFALEERQDGFVWHVLNDEVQARLELAFRSAPASTVLRAADALHLACAATHDFKEVYSNDRRLLAAAPLFGLRGLDII